ncbi:MAG: ABC transporter ATP-binding protein [Methanomicrobia archaeon]|nr:ABC transporter ATP-binding protein [Methanomicrobia archaeon]
MIIQTKNLSKWYGTVLALNDVSINVKEGITGLLGPNGAGKSTFLKIAIGVIKENKGEIKVFGMNVWNNTELKKRIGYCPENDAFYSFMTGYDFLKTMGRLNKIKDFKRINEVLKDVDLWEDRNRVISGYSKGMRQKLKVAQALLHDPELLFLDEPLSGTDPIARIKIMEITKKLVEDGKNIIVSSHILHEVERMADKVLLINKGRVLAEGKIHEIREAIDKFPHSVKLLTEEKRKLAKLLIGYDFVESVKLLEDGILLKTPKPDIFYSELPKILIKNSLEITHLSSPDDNLESVFRYLMR